MDEMVRKRARLMRALRKAPVVEVAGVIGAGGAGGVCGQGERLWSFQYPLSAWRVGDGPVQRRELVVHQPMSERGVNAAMKRWWPYELVRMRARVLEKTVMGSPRGLLVGRAMKLKRDAGLMGAVEELKKPVRFKDAKLGTFTLDRSVGWFEGKGQWGGRKARISLVAESGAVAEKAAGVARAVWRGQRTWDKRARALAAAKLLKVKNSGWLDEGQKPVSAAEFVRKMRFSGVTVEPDGKVELWYDDGDLFWGHSIVVYGDVKKGVKRASVEG